MACSRYWAVGSGSAPEAHVTPSRQLVWSVKITVNHRLIVVLSSVTSSLVSVSRLAAAGGSVFAKTGRFMRLFAVGTLGGDLRSNLARSPGPVLPASTDLTWRAPRVLHRFRAVAAADVVRRRSSTRGGVSGGSLLGHLPLALMGACLSMSASVGPDGDERTRERLGAPTAATCSAPRRVDSQAWRCLPCAVRLQGADNPLIHILSIAQLMEIHEAFNRFGAPCCVHPRGLLRSAQLAP